MPEFKEWTDENYADGMAATVDGVALVHKKLCPHCKNMMKVIERFAASCPSVSLSLVDSEDCPAASEALGAQRVPTLAVIKAGQVRQTRSGLMNPRELAAMHESA